MDGVVQGVVSVSGAGTDWVWPCKCCSFSVGQSFSYLFGGQVLQRSSPAPRFCQAGVLSDRITTAIMLAPSSLETAHVCANTFLRVACVYLYGEPRDVQICHEVQLHAQLDHPNILPLYGAFFEDDDIFLIMPYAHQGSVYHLLRRQSFPECDLVSAIVLPFLAGLQHLHSKGYLHRDIKTENVLVDGSGRVMIADFGLAIDMHTTPAVHRVGTPVYMVRLSCYASLLTAPFAMIDGIGIEVL